MFIGDGNRVLAGEGGLAGNHLVEDHAEGVDVASGIDGVALGLLGGEIGGGAHHRPGLGQVARCPGGPGNAEVRDLHLAPSVDEYVARFDVAVNHPAPVGEVEGGGHAGPYFGRPDHVQRTRLQHRRDRRPVDVLHHDVVGVLPLPPVEYGDDVGVAEIRRRLGFPAEALDERPIDRQFGEQDLDRDRAVQEKISSQVDLGHPAAGNVVDHLIAVTEDLLLRHSDLQTTGGTRDRGTAQSRGVGTMPVVLPTAPWSMERTGSWRRRWPRRSSRPR